MLQDKALEIAGKFKHANYELSIEMAALILSILVNLYKMYRLCHDEPTYEEFKKIDLRKRFIIRTKVYNTFGNTDGFRLQLVIKMANLIEDAIKNLTKEEFDVILEEYPLDR